MSATRQAYRTASTAASPISSMQRPRWAFIARSSSGETVCMRIRVEWKEKRAERWRCSSAGISVSTVTLELGTTSPIR